MIFFLLFYFIDLSQLSEVPIMVDTDQTDLFDSILEKVQIQNEILVKNLQECNTKLFILSQHNKFESDNTSLNFSDNFQASLFLQTEIDNYLSEFFFAKILAIFVQNVIEVICNR